MADYVSLAGVSAAAALLTFIRLGEPRALMFDETYYAKDACWYVEASKQLCETGAEQTTVHPPLGKWLIGLGIKVFGYDSFGWRISAAVAGVGCVLLLFILGRILLASTIGAVVAAGLLAIDPLSFVQARIAMLDVFVAFFGLAAFTFVVIDRAAAKRLRGASARPWLAGAGIAAGAAFASKWSGALVIAAVVALTLGWEWGSRRRIASAPARRRAAPLLTWLVIAPLVTYALTYLGRFEGRLLAAPWGPESWFRQLWDRQLEMFHFHSTLEATHPYQSPPWSWPLLKRPVSYFFEAPGGDYREVLAVGSPLVWTAAFIALIWLAVRWLGRRDSGAPEGVILAGFLFSWAPWLVLAGDRSAVFLFYMLPSVPFMCLAIGRAAARLVALKSGRPLVMAFAAGAVGVFVWLYPLLAAVAIPEEDWRNRIWIFDDCDKPKAVETRTTVTETRAEKTIERTRRTRSADDLPPEGWCWI